MCCKVVFVLAEIRYGKLRQEVDKAALCLGHKAVAVSQKQHVLDPAMLQQYIHQCNDGTGLAGAGCHDKQGFPSILVAKAVTNRLDGTFLIVPSGNVFVYIHIGKAGTHGLQIEPFFKVALGVNGSDLALGIDIVHDSGVETVGQE